MIGYTSAVSRSGRKSMYRSPMKRNRRSFVKTRKPVKKPSYKKKEEKDTKPKGFKMSYKFKMYTFSSMKYKYERDKRMSKKHP